MQVCKSTMFKNMIARRFHLTTSLFYFPSSLSIQSSAVLPHNLLLLSLCGSSLSLIIPLSLCLLLFLLLLPAPHLPLSPSYSPTPWSDLPPQGLWATDERYLKGGGGERLCGHACVSVSSWDVFILKVACVTEAVACVTCETPSRRFVDQQTRWRRFFFTSFISFLSRFVEIPLKNYR